MNCKSGRAASRGGHSSFVPVLLFSLLVSPILFSSASAAACVKTNRGQLITTNYIKINKLNWGSNTSVETAASMWNSAGGGYPGFWTNTNNPPGSFAVLNVERVIGIAPVMDRCGSFQGLNVKVYTKTLKSSTNQVVPCDTLGLAQNVAHEFGHRLGLDDAPAGASDHSIMAQVNGKQHSVQACEAQKADEINKTQTEVEEEENEDCGKDPSMPHCFPESPILLRLPGGSWDLTDVPGGVTFDLNGDGVEESVSWTALGSELGFLFADRDGDGCASNGTELFGNATPGPEGSGGTYTNGFEALVEWDSDSDGWVTFGDADWDRLRLWVDRNHDGDCDSTEVSGLLDEEVVGLGLEYRKIGRRDPHGNFFMFVGVSLVERDGDLTAEKIYDVYFSSE